MHTPPTHPPTVLKLKVWMRVKALNGKHMVLYTLLCTTQTQFLYSFYVGKFRSADVFFINWSISILCGISNFVRVLDQKHFLAHMRQSLK